MSDKFNPSNFDDAEPMAGHRLRFENKMDKEFSQNTFNWKWLAMAASFTLLISIGYFQFNKASTSTEVIAENEEAFPLKQAENYYENSFSQQLNAIAKVYKGPESKQMIQESLELITELQKEYKKLEEELKTTGDQRVATAMILNYKSRITILELLVKQLEYVNQLKTQSDEKINA